MRPLLTSFLVLGLAAAAGRADDQAPTRTPPSSPAYEALKKECEEAQKKFAEGTLAASKALREARTLEEKKEAQKRLRASLAGDPGPQFAARFLDFAQKNPKDPAAFEALNLALRHSGGRTAPSDLRSRIIQELEDQYVTRPEIGRMIPVLTNFNEAAAVKLVRAIIAQNPDRKIQARACKALAAGRTRAAILYDRLQSDEKTRKLIEEQGGKENLAKLLANGEHARQDAAELTKLLRDKYADVLPVVEVGKAAPEVVCHDLDGKEVWLSALRGRVVVLNVWSTSSKNARALFPQLRKLTGQLRDKPFTLVHISADPQKATLTDFLAKEKLPGTHWWNGPQGGILEDWEIHYFPTIYVIDAKGVLRFKGVKDDQLEEAVYGLLKEQDEKKGK